MEQKQKKALIGLAAVFLISFVFIIYSSITSEPKLIEVEHPEDETVVSEEIISEVQSEIVTEEVATIIQNESYSNEMSSDEDKSLFESESYQKGE